LAYLLADPSGQPDYAAMEGNFAARCASKAKNPDLLLLAERSFKGDRVQIVRETLLTTRLLSLARAPEEFPFGPISAAAAPTADVAALVAAAQAALADLGYSPGFATGAFNAQTASALRAFQRDAGLPEDGELSARALALLEAATAPWQ
jgi:murein L,D-transpeptidase YcbB/YkuD